VEHEQALFRLFGKFCPEGTILYKEGEPGDEMFVVQSGTVRVGRAVPGGAAVWKTLEADGLLGEEAFFRRTPRAFRAEVRKDARLLQVSDRNLDAVVRIGPEAALRLEETLFDAGAAAWVDLETWTLAHVIRRVEPYLPEAGAAGLRADELAEQAGCESYDVFRLLVELERLGGLAREGDVFRVPGAPQLAAAVRALTASGASAPAGAPR
jgi:CRP-like cAMP-binding protein